MSLLFAPLPVPEDINVMQTVAMFVPDGHGEFRFDPARGRSRLDCPASAHGPTMVEARRRLARIGAAAGAIASIDLTELEPITFHPLGGAAIGKVCDAYGRVWGQPGLYVNDGALIPGSTACANPSLTIAALAERYIDGVLRDDLDVVF